MGEGIFGNIVKGPVHLKVDAVANSGARDSFLENVKAAATADDYITVLRNNGLHPNDADYLRTWWYNEGVDGFWPWLQPIYPILKRGLIKALEVAKEAALPLDSYWATGGTAVQVLVTKSPQQVTRIILTPPSPPPTVLRTKDAPIWVVRRGSPRHTVGYSKPPARDEVVEAVEESQGIGIITWRIRDF